MRLSLVADNGIVPVLMFHSVGISDQPWVWSDMSESVSSFQRILEDLQRRGFRTIGLEDLYDYMQGNRKLQDRSVVLTFDDGYLDNWIYVAPLLQKYGMRGVVYVTPEFVEPDGPCRPMARFAANGSLTAEPADAAGFMNWDELRQLDAAGVLDVQSHALTHTWYFSSGNILDVHRRRPVHQYPWLSWNERPDRKPYYLCEDQQTFLPWGYPVLQHEKSLVVRRFHPEKDSIAELVEFARREGFGADMNVSAWSAEARKRFPDFFSTRGLPGSCETDDEYRARVEYELRTSREIIGKKLDKNVGFLSWPGGGVNEVAAEIARTVGYKSWTLSSWQEPSRRNSPGVDAEGIKRVSGRGETYWKGKPIADDGAHWVIRRVLIHQGSLVSRVGNALAKLAAVARGRHRATTPDETL